MRCSRTLLVVTTILLLLALLACSLVFYTYSSESCPEGAFPCVNSSLCVPQHSICNSHVDCPYGDDEDVACVLEGVPTECDCGEETALWCKNRSLSAVPQSISDNVTKMILANNSIILSDNSFTNYCCITVIHLEGNNLKELPDRVFHNQSSLRKLLLQNNRLEVLPPLVFYGLKNLEWLFLQENKIHIVNLKSWGGLDNLEWIEFTHNHLMLENEIFPELPKLKILNLAYNKIKTIRSETFCHLKHLAELDLRENNLQYIDGNAFWNLKFLNYLDLSSNKLCRLDEKTFIELVTLDKLMLGHNQLQEVPTKLFESLGNLSSLDLREIELDNIDTDMFKTLNKLDFVYFKKYYYCTYAPKVPKCTPNSDAYIIFIAYYLINNSLSVNLNDQPWHSFPRLSSFEHLLSKPVQRITVWLVAIFTCSANILVILGRFTARDENQALSFVVRNLAVSDLLMGCYLIVIAYEDMKFRGVYNNHAHQWMSSVTCTTIGITAMVSSEVSVLILAFLSLERFLLIAVPFSGHQKLNFSSATYSLIIIWLVGFIIAIAPVFHWKDSTRFYGTNGLCFPLHIDIPYLMGWQYSAFVFLGINTFVLVVMVIVYSAMFLSIMRTRTATSINVGDSEFAIRFFLIVLTDAMCWAPITAIKILALCRVHIPGSLYAWVVVFVLPVNSAINPLLYTFTTPKYCKIIKDLSCVIVSSNSNYGKKKHLSADTESSLYSNKRNIYMAESEKKRSGGQLDLLESCHQLQPLQVHVYAEDTL